MNLRREQCERSTLKEEARTIDARASSAFMERGAPSGGTCGYSLTNHAQIADNKWFSRQCGCGQEIAVFVLSKLFHFMENLQETITTNSLHGSEESKNALRELVDAVIINPPENRERNGN